MAEGSTFEGWAILELMGHRKLGGMLSEATIGGGSFIRIDIPTDKPSTQFYSPASVYAITPTTEEIATACAKANAPQPVSRWELPALQAPKDRKRCPENGMPCDCPLDNLNYCAALDEAPEEGGDDVPF